MENKEDKTTVISNVRNEEFTSVKTGENDKNMPQETIDTTVDRKGQTEGSGIGHLPRNIVEAMKEDFSISAFVLILVGYVIIETFSASGVNMKEYLFLIFVLFFVVGLIKSFNKEDLLKSFKEVVDTGFKKNKNIVIGILVLTIILEFSLNHWSTIRNTISYFQSIIMK